MAAKESSQSVPKPRAENKSDPSYGSLTILKRPDSPHLQQKSATSAAGEAAPNNGAKGDEPTAESAFAHPGPGVSPGPIVTPRLVRRKGEDELTDQLRFFGDLSGIAVTDPPDQIICDQAEAVFKAGYEDYPVPRASTKVGCSRRRSTRTQCRPQVHERDGNHQRGGRRRPLSSLQPPHCEATAGATSNGSTQYSRSSAHELMAAAASHTRAVSSYVRISSRVVSLMGAWRRAAG